jgi:hypothetical protein
MARRKPYKNITIHPAQGGALIGSASDDVPITQESNYLSSSANYTTKLNFRRETDGELRREGWELFNPRDISTEVSQWGNRITFNAIDSKYPIRAIHQFPGTNGTPVLIAIAGGGVWRLRTGEDTYAKDYGDPDARYATEGGSLTGNEYWIASGDDFIWQKIYEFDRHMDVFDNNDSNLSPFEGGAYRWEIVDVQNHVVINNGVDLPIIYKSEWSFAVPLYSLRENGVISVGTISAFQDRLFCADLTVLESGYDTLFQDFSDPYGHLPDDPQYENIKVQRYQYRMVYSAEGEPKLFNSGAILNGAVVMESGGLAGTITVSSGVYTFTPSYNFNIGGEGSMYKLRNLAEYQGPEAYAINFLNPPMVKTVNEDGGLLISGLFLSLENGVYRISNSENGNVTLLDNVEGGALADGDYTVVLRPYAEQLSSPAAFREFAQDGSRILKMKQLADKLVVYRDSGFFFISRTNSADVPFAIEPRYTGGRVADFRHTIIDVDGNQHIFMGNSGIYSINRTSTEPQPISLFEIGPPFWQIVPPDLAEFVYAVDNPITREIFINCPLGQLKNSKGDFIDEVGDTIYSEKYFEYALGSGPYADDPDQSGIQEYWSLNVNIDPEPRLEWGVIAYDYINKTLSTIDTSFTSAAYIRKPKHNRVGPDEPWFVMGVHQSKSEDQIYVGTQYREDAKYGGVMVRYGYGPPALNQRSPYRIYSRLGYGYTSVLKSGLIDFGDSFSDKEVRTYVLELSSKYGTTPVQVKISTSTSPQGTEQIETMQTVDGRELDYVELNNLVDENMIPMYIQAPYIRDQITVLPELVYKNSIMEVGYVINQERFFETEYPVVNNNPIKIVGRTFEVSGVDTRSATQAYNQG